MKYNHKQQRLKTPRSTQHREIPLQQTRCATLPGPNRKGKSGMRQTRNLSIKDMINHMTQSGNTAGNPNPIQGTPLKRPRSDDGPEDSPAKKVCHPTQPKWVAHLGKDSSMTQTNLNMLTNDPSLGAPQETDPGAGRTSPPDSKREGAKTPGPTDVTHSYSKKRKVQEAKHPIGGT